MKKAGPNVLEIILKYQLKSLSIVPENKLPKKNISRNAIWK
jgi:hypothetical protein